MSSDVAVLGLPVHEIHLWYCFCDQPIDGDRLERCRAVLSAEERQRNARFRFDADRTTYVLAHALVRHALSHYAGIPPEDWQFHAPLNEKPAISSAHQVPLEFSLTHTKGLVACAITCGRHVGVDAERIDRQIDLDVARNFAPSEQEHILGLTERAQRDAFFEYWTLKECYIKARGLGLSLSLASFAISLPPATDDVRLAWAADDDPASWRFYSLRPRDSHRLAIAVRVKPDEKTQLVTYETFPLEDGPVDGV